MASPADPGTIEEPPVATPPAEPHVEVPVEIGVDIVEHRFRPARRDPMRSLACTAASIVLHLGALALLVSAPDTAWRLAGLKDNGKTLLGNAAHDRSTPPAVDVAIVDPPKPPQPPRRPTPPARPREPTPKEPAVPAARQVLAARPTEAADPAQSVPVQEGRRQPDTTDMPVAPIPTPRPTPPRPPTRVADASRDRQQGSDRSRDRRRRGAIGGALDGIVASRATGAAADETGDGSVTDYPGTIARKLDAALSYPEEAQRRKIKGQARVQFLIDASGNVAAVEVIGSSGSAILDQAAVDTVNRAAPFPPIPAESGRTEWPFKVTLAFGR